MMNLDDNPMQHPDEPQAGGSGSPRFGLLLIVLVIAVVFIGVMTFVSESYFSP